MHIVMPFGDDDAVPNPDKMQATAFVNPQALRTRLLRPKRRTTL
jgi:hypothetical protein